jgi:phosphoribosylformimino-5-aminoimidazole carboxamide ribotide isomerase
MHDTLTIYPAIDLCARRVVRLREGDPAQQTVYGDDPLEMARQWIAAGAEWLHVVNLDGALEEGGEQNWLLLPELVASGAQVQFGGGLRTFKDIARALHCGVARVLLGTTAIEDPDLVADAIDHFGTERIVVGLDARDGRVRSHGWQTGTDLTPEELGWQMNVIGVTIVLYTDIGRDGLQSGVNVEATVQLA